MLERIAGASLRSGSSLSINLVAQGPRGHDHIRFNHFRQNSIQTVEDLVDQIVANSPAISASPSLEISRDYYEQGTAKSIESILRVVAPRLPVDSVDIIVSHDLDVSTSHVLKGTRRSFLVRISDSGMTRVSQLSQKCWAIACSDAYVQDVLISAALSICLLRRFPFTLEHVALNSNHSLRR
jgi:hypothetical protein